MLKSKNPSWIAEMHKMAKKGAVTKEDEQIILEKMKIPNDDVSIEDVAFKIYKNYF